MKIAFVLVAAALAAAQTFDALDRDIERTMKAQSIPGVSLAVFQDGKVIYSKAYGVASTETGAPVTTETLFRLGSTAKIFTSAAAIKLALDGKIRLDQPVSTYAPELPARLGAVTLSQLLNMTAGLRDDAPMDGPHDETALAANVRSWTEDRVLAEPGKLFSYANPAYVLAGYVLERATGKKFADVIDELVVKPAGLERTTFRPFVAVTYPFALGHGAGGKVLRPFPDHAGSWPPGSLFSSAAEMSRFLIGVMNLEGGLAKLRDQQVEIPGMGRGYGWGSMFSGDAMFLPGGRAGFGSAYYLLPNRKTGAVVMTNMHAVNFLWAARQAVHTIFPQPEQAKPAPATEVEMTTEEMERYAGVYRNQPPIQTELAVREGKLQIRAGTRWFPVAKLSDGSFRAPGAGQLQNFRLRGAPGAKPDHLLAEAWALAREKGGQ